MELENSTPSSQLWQAPSTGRHADVGRCLKSVGGRAACCRFFKPWSANVQPSRLLANLQSGSGPFYFFYLFLFIFFFFERWCLREEKNNLSDTRESAANQFERISWVLMDYRLSVHSVPLALLEYVTNCAFWHPGGAFLLFQERTHSLSGKTFVFTKCWNSIVLLRMHHKLLKEGKKAQRRIVLESND